MRWLDGITDSMDMSFSELGSWWWTGWPGMLRFMWSQRVGHDWVTELNWTDVALSDSKTPHRHAAKRVSWCLETSPLSQLPTQDGSLFPTSLSLLLSFILSPTSFRRQWAAFLGGWCPPPAFRSCFVEFAQHSNDLLINFWGRKWSPWPISLPS